MQYIKFNGNTDIPTTQLVNIDTNNQQYSLVQNKIYFKCDYYVSFEHTIVLPHIKMAYQTMINHFCTAPSPPLIEHTLPYSFVQDKFYHLLHLIFLLFIITTQHVGTSYTLVVS